MKYSHTYLKSELGKLMLVADEESLVALLWEKHPEHLVRPLKFLAESEEDPSHPVLREAVRQLGEYFKGKRTSFDLPIEFQGTEFQKKIWKALCKIEFGKTETYGELARKIGSPKASRAVGAAIGRNPVSIIVPCHRVVGSNGSLTGFAGGIKTKSWLLEHEGDQ